MKNMVVHIALFQWKSNISKTEIEQAFADVRALKGKVAGVIDIFCGENFSPWAEKFTHAVVVLTKDRNALNAYRKHPNHTDVAKRIEAMEDKSLGVDFEA